MNINIHNYCYIIIFLHYNHNIIFLTIVSYLYCNTSNFFLKLLNTSIYLFYLLFYICLYYVFLFYLFHNVNINIILFIQFNIFPNIIS